MKALERRFAPASLEGRPRVGGGGPAFGGDQSSVATFQAECIAPSM